MKNLFYRMLFIAFVSAALGFAMGYERGANDAKAFTLERVK